MADGVPATRARAAAVVPTMTGVSYVFVRAEDGTTRLLLKDVAACRHALTPLLWLSDLVMARKQLRTFARR